MLTFALTCFCGAGDMSGLQGHPATDSYDGWRLGTQAYTFRLFSFYEAVDKAAELGFNWIEAYPGQRLCKEKDGSITMHHTMSADNREEAKQKLKACGVKLVNYGVVSLPNDEKECRKVFDFAKEMGIETIVSEPPKDAFDLLDKLCNEYEINVAVHNHPEPSMYWNPDTVLEACKGRSKRIGACADTGHWMRSGINPLEAIKKLKGRIISLHFKDLNEFGNKEAHDTPWGTGEANLKAILAELDKQGFKGVFSVEYEHKWENSVPDIRKCAEFFNKTSAALKASGWGDLFKQDLSNAKFKPDSWTLAEGVLTRNGGGDIWTNKKYSDFILDLGFKVAKDSNSGVFLRTGNTTDWLPWIEVQVFDSYGQKTPTKHDCGGIFDILAPSKNMVNPVGQWNRLTIMARGSRINVVLNGERVVDMDLDEWTEAGKNPDGSPNKFDVAYKDLPREGYLCLQDHGQEVWFRNVKIKELK